MSRRTTLVSAALLVSAVGAALATVAPPAVAATAAPTVTGGSALGLGATKWAHFTVTGTGFVAGATVSFFKTATPITGAAGAASTDVTQDAGTTSTVSSDGTTLTFEVTVTATATESLDLSITNPGGTAVSCYTGGFGTLNDAGCLTIEAAPSALKFTAGGVGVGAMSHAAPFTATGLVAGPGMLLSSDSKFTSTAFTYAGTGTAAPTGATATVTVPATSATGADKVILVNGDGGRDVADSLTLDAAPSLSSYSVTTGGDAGNDLIITTVGSGFSTSPAPVVTFLGQNHTATSPMAQSFTVDLGTVPATTPGGRKALIITNADGGTYVDNGSDASITAPISIVGAPVAPPAVTVSKVGDGTATVSFSAVPSTSGGAPVTSYNVTTTPDTGAHLVYVNQPLQYVLTGLTDGTAYTATVAATNTDSKTTISQTGPGTTSVQFTPTSGVAATGPTATTLPVQTVTSPAAVPSVSLKSSLKTVNFASPVTISGVATLNGAPITNTPIDLQIISSKGVRTDTGETTTTDSSGHFTFAKVYPSVSTTFGVGIGTTTTAGIRVVVTQYLLLTNKTLSKTRAYTITGLGTPGTTDKKAKVVLFKVTKTGHRVGTITSTYLGKGKSAKGYSAGISTFTLKSTLKKGSYLVAVAILGTSTNGPVQTKPFTIKVP